MIITVPLLLHTLHSVGHDHVYVEAYQAFSELNLHTR